MQQFLDLVYTIVILIGTIYCSKFIGANRSYLLPFVYLIVVSISETINFINSIFDYTLIANPVAVGNFVNLFSSFLLVLILFRNIQNEKLRQLFLIASIIIGIFSMMQFPFYNILHAPAINQQIAFSVSYVLGALIIYMDYIIKPEIKSITRSFGFLFATGLLVWTVFFLFSAGARHYFGLENLSFLIKLHALFTLVNILFYSFFIRAIYCLRYSADKEFV